jgi:nicotinamidase-related amidase
MRVAYEKGYNVVTLTDCCGATSVEQHDAAVNFTFPMFSVPLTGADFLAKL